MKTQQINTFEKFIDISLRFLEEHISERKKFFDEPIYNRIKGEV